MPRPSSRSSAPPDARAVEGRPAVFLLTGEDEPTKARRIDDLLRERLEESARAFNLDRLSARDVDPSTLATVLETPPLLGDWRVVVLSDAENANASVAAVVGDFLARPLPGTCLIAVASGKLAGEPWSTFRRIGHEETFEPPRGAAAVKARIKAEVRRAGKDIAEPAAALLAEMNPEGAGPLATELEKVLAHVGERPRVEVTDVEAVAVSSAEANKYNFLDLVGMGRREEALAELHALLEGGESPIYLVTLLTQHFLLLGGIRACEARGLRDAEAIGRSLGKPAWLLDRKNFRIRGYQSPRAQARRYRKEAVDRWLAGLLELDLALKSSRLPPAALIEETILRLMSAEPEAARRSES